MRTYIYKVVATLLVMTISVNAAAQDDVEYKMEIGGGVGTNTYLGDFNSNIFGTIEPAASVVYRIIINPFSALRTSAMYARLRGSAEGYARQYPDIDASYKFTESVADLSFTYEYNFLPYGTGKEYRGAKRLVPFISLGIGLTALKANCGKWDFSKMQPHDGSSTVVTANFPIGVGVKYKVKPRLNLSLDWQMHFTLSDYLDGVADPYRISSSGLFKNTDCYSTLMLSLTYSFMPKCQTCHKDR